MFEPDSPSVQLDYALLLAWADQHALALAFLNPLLKRTDIPQGLRQQLLQWQSKWHGVLQAGEKQGRVQGEDTASQKLASQLRLYTGLGFDTNVNNGLSTDTIPLTLPNEVLTLRVDPSERSQQGGLTDWSVLADWASLTSSDSARWALGLAASGTNPWGQSAFNTQSIQSSLRAFPLVLKDWGLHEFLARPTGLGLRFGASWYGQQPLVQAVGAEFAWRLSEKAPAAGCEPSEFGLALDARRYPANPAFSHTLAQLSWGANCPLKSGDLRWLSYLIHEEPLNERPGRQVHRFGLQTGLQTFWSWGRLLSTLQLEWSRDAKPYSDLLENGARRQTRLVNLGFVASRPLNSKLQWVARVHYRTQLSNLPLFSSNGLLVGTGLEATFR